MRDIVATIAGEQDRIIRAPLDVPIVVQGGPGTGKTAVGLHRAAFLLYEHRVQLEREGVLVLGPNRLFLSYISEVLPSLGEVAVVQTTLAGLVPEWPVRAEDPPELAALKGDPRMAEVIAKACRLQVTTPTEVLAANTRWGTVRLGPGELAESRRIRTRAPAARSDASARGSGARSRGPSPPTLSDRRAAVVDIEDVAEGPECRPRAATGTRPDLAGTFGDRGGACRPRQRRPSAEMATARDPRRVASAPFCAGDDRSGSADGLERSRSAAARRGAGGAVGSSKALRPCRRRRGPGPVRDGVSDGGASQPVGTVLHGARGPRPGDGPGSQERWEDAFDALGMPPGTRRRGAHHRLPGARSRSWSSPTPCLLRRVRRSSRTGSVRRTDDDPELRQVASQALVAEVADEAAELHAEHQTVAVVAVARDCGGRVRALQQDQAFRAARPGQSALAGEVSMLRPPEAKGLEFDAVIVVEPADFVALEVGPDCSTSRSHAPSRT